MRTSLFVLERIADPDDEPVTLTDLKAQLRTYASNTDEDSYITNLGIAAREWVESETSRALMEQQWRLTIDNFRGWMWPLVLDSVRSPFYGPFWGDFTFPRTGDLLLRRSPLISIDKFVSIDPVTRAETDISDDQFSLADELSRWPRILPQNGANWSQGIFKVEFTAGYSDVDVIPRKFKQAILLHAEAHYDRDPAMMDKLVAAACNLIDRERGDLGIG